MRKKIVILGIFFGFIVSIGFRLWTEIPPISASNQSVSISATYYEQIGYSQFVKEASSNINLMLPFYLSNGGLSRSIRNCTTYIKVEKILEKNETNDQKLGEQKQPLSKGDTKQKRIALTFDDGPHPNVTNQILETLNKHEVKATFFVLGQNVAKHPDIVKKADGFGHEIANHSWSHKNFTKLNAKQMQAEIDRANEAISDAIGKYPKVYRPPYGAIDRNVREAIDLAPVLWNIDTYDWHHKTPAKTLANLKVQAKNNGIILMHDIHPQTAEALEDVILYLKGEGYEFVTTSELI